MPTSLVEREPPILATGAEDANSKSALAHRARVGRLSWSGPLVVVTGRSVLIIAAQALVAGLAWMRFHVWSWNGAAKWWTVYATLVDAGCLALMAAYTRKEGIRLRDLIGRVRLRWGGDFFSGVGMFVLVFPFFILGAASATRIIYGSGRPPSLAGLADSRVLPLWGI